MELQRYFTLKIILAMVLGIALGLSVPMVPTSLSHTASFLLNTIFSPAGQIFIRLLKMLVVPIVFVSLVCGVCRLGSLKGLGRMGIKTIFLYILTTAIAISIALLVANWLQVGVGMHIGQGVHFTPPKPVSPVDVIVGMFPINPIRAFTEGHMLQIIIFAVLLGMAMVASAKKAESTFLVFQSLNEILMTLIFMVMSIAPYGVFCLLVVLFAKLHVGDILHLLTYFLAVVLVLLIQLFVVYGGLLLAICRQGIFSFIRKVHPAMLFAFSTSSSSATIPVTLRTVRERLGIDGSTASFVIPLGATINMDGTAIMQGVATVFIAHAYHIAITMTGYLTVIGMATLASIGTAGVPGVGLLTLAMVLTQVGLPVDGIALIIGVDRLLDMLRTALNVSGDAMVAKLVAKG